MIFAWRLVAKPVLHAILPPIFRLLAHAFTLPHRRFYTPATDYQKVPQEKGLHPIPSVIDLPTQLEVEASGLSLVPDNPYRHMEQHLKARNTSNTAAKNAVQEERSDLTLAGAGEVVKHYDADGEFFVPCGPVFPFRVP